MFDFLPIVPRTKWDYETQSHLIPTRRVYDALRLSADS